MDHKDIPGWMQETTQHTLDRIIREQKIKSVLEVGSFVGKSAVFFAERVDKVLCVDPFVMWDEGRENGDAMKHGEDFFDEFQHNIVRSGYSHKIFPVRETSQTAFVTHYHPLLADLIYIDGAHDYISVLYDVMMWKTRAFRIICGDDYDENWPGVKKAVDEVFKKKLQVEGNLWYVIL